MLKKINTEIHEQVKRFRNSTTRVRVMYQDEAGFGRIGTPHYCWTGSDRPHIPCHHIREYRYAYGAVSPKDGKHFFLVLPRSDTACMNYFLKELSATYPDDYILLICDNAVWHRSKALEVPDNIKILFIPPYTPEMNPIEQVWAKIREIGFNNRIFKTLDDVMDQLCETIRNLKNEAIKSICHRDWMRLSF